jgi:glycerophosphoryl diester phosphodiesterase
MTVKVPVNDLTLKEFHELGTIITSKRHAKLDKPEWNRFPTLEELFLLLPTWLPFNIEVKYPSFRETSEQNVHPFDRNAYVDDILRVVEKYHTSRRVFFSSFDLKVCIFLKLKQTKIPVLFLNEGGDYVYWNYELNSIHQAARLCSRYNLNGIVMQALIFDKLKKAPYLLKQHFPQIQSLITWGELNTVPEKSAFLGLDARITDRLDLYK